MASSDYYDDRIYELYYQEVGQYPILSPDNERTLLERYHHCPHCKRKIPPRVDATNCPDCGAVAPEELSGRDYSCSNCGATYAPIVNSQICPHCGSGRDLEARKALINANLRFVIRRAKKFTQDPEGLRVLISAGNMGLMQAVDRFDINTNHRFLTYAEWWIRKEIMDELNNSKLVHIPTHKQKTLRRIHKNGKYVCIHCKARTDSIYNTNHLPSCTSEDGHELEVPLVKDIGVLSDALPIDNLALCAGDDVESSVIDSGMESLLKTVLHRMELNERDKFIILGYFNVASGDRKSDPKKLPQLAAITGITPERVRQIKERLLLALKKELRKESITKTAEFC